MTPLASVVIPTHNRSYVLRLTLPTYLGQAGIGEVIVVDDASTDDTEHVVQLVKQGSSIPVKYVSHDTHRGPAAARNTGTALARYPFVAFGEDDLFFGVDYVCKLMQKLENLRAAIVGGILIYLQENETPETGIRRYLAETRSDIPLVRPGLHELNLSAKTVCDTQVTCLHAIILTRTDLVKKVGFDESYKGNAYREETDFQASVLSHGGTMYVTPDAFCFHLPRAQAADGGHHSRHWLLYEYWTVHNNNYFVHKHYSKLRAHLDWKGTEAQVKRDFALYRWQEWIKPRIVYDFRERVKPYVPTLVVNFLRRCRAYSRR